MAGWSRDKRVAVERAFYQFLDQCFVASKDVSGEVICLGQNLYEGQRKLITDIFDGLEEDIHEFYILKSRQLGISTITRALTTFFLGVFPGLKGALVFDTREHMGEARNDLVAMLEALPTELQFPAIKQDNREGLTLITNSKMLFMAAGVSKRKSSKGLGASYGLSLAHCSEMAAWENEEGLESFKNSLSDKNPDRLYIWESTARGYTQWYEMWNTARGDTLHCKCIFLGWWSKDSQVIERTDKDWALYGDNIPPSKEEQRKIALVFELYGHQITVEQLAWVRRKYDPSARQEGDAAPEFTASSSRIQEQPWLEEEAFQQSGSVFFSAEKLKDQSDKWVSGKFQTYMFSTGIEFSDMRVFKAENSKSMELKVWEEPQQEAVYVFGIDPAFGENERNDRSAIQVLRCYADGCDQVAEYAFPLINTMQFGWVIAALMGWYSSKPLSEVRYVLELNGPGSAVYNELRSLKAKLESGVYPALQEQGVKNVFQNVRTYIYSRPDSMGAGANYHLKTTQPIKVMLMERMRDFISNGQVHIRSDALIKEMSTIARDGDSIEAPGALKDDRALALAFAIHCWEEKARRQLVQQRRTRQAEEARRNVTTIDQVRMYNANMMDTFFNQKNKARAMERQFAMRQAWRRR
jgi:hypothetical protein